MTRTRAQAWRRQGCWVLEVTGTALASFTVAGSVAVAVTATGWAPRLLPGAVAVLSAVVVAALVRTRPRRWHRSASRDARVLVL